MKKNSLIRLAVLFLCMALVAGIYTFAVIPSVRKEEKKTYDAKLAEITSLYVSVPLYNGETPLVKGTVFTEALDGLFTEMRVPASCVSNEMITDISMAYGMSVSGTLSKGEPLTFANLTKTEFEEKETERLKEFEVSSLVCDKVTAGTFIDVTVKYEDGSYDVVLAKKRVYDVKMQDARTGLFTIVIAVDEKEYSDMLAAEKLGTIDTRLYTDSAYPASVPTFGVTEN